ncbi:hypothetical protein [Rhodoferax sp.]|jgi:uncharacterized membrane protein YqjE|uniref:hypothetical protein n=1 Tax=Rhodoferax sp. TaxID=50421 RepID=UPI00271C11A1|nr:hypothetical protein [Rhodoferax sp.]MDO9142795.1 hypothetical protein [Rhodoferax sp.]MDP1529727.1 hypothetical protein [Rhodoferax sp.]MDP1945803.1 hypothetical protein [Rhodoferax sp.]MDP2441378.1 hypothetical protein [Rhodoferax sp.]MDP3191704.1 hypothetical protein [Rhodoferax sp.]
MHPLLELLLARPQLLADHAQAYGALFTEEMGEARAALQRWAIWRAITLCSLFSAAILAGMALMLWAMLPPSPMQASWLLLVTPMVPLAVAAVCWPLAKKNGTPPLFDLMRAQIRADKAMLRAARAP